MAFLRNIPSDNTTDNELVALYKTSSDTGVVGQLYERYMELVYGVCLKYLKNPDDAQDSVINIYEELVSKLLKHEVENFRGWLYTLAKNHCLMKLRSDKKHRVVNMDIELVQSMENLHLNGEPDKEEDFQKLEYCMGQLQAEQRKVIDLFYLQGKCYNQISELTGMEWNKVRSLIQNGRRNLKICMDSQKAKTIVENAVIKK